MTDKPKTFINTPEDQKKEEVKAIEETAKQAKAEMEIIKAEAPPLGEVIKEIGFWVMLSILIVTYGTKLFFWVQYSLQNNAEITFTKEHPEYTKAIREIYEGVHAEADVNLMKALKGK